jgi:hypothetical protein
VAGLQGTVGALVAEVRGLRVMMAEQANSMRRVTELVLGVGQRQQGVQQQRQRDGRAVSASGPGPGPGLTVTDVGVVLQ